ncbi:MAG: GIY-YIG nuclease family protein [Candidatus Jorgensenbacteria bacterium]
MYSPARLAEDKLQFPKTYVGSTTDLKRRLAEHNSGKTIILRKV